MVRLDDAIQDLLEDREYAVDVETCEEYIDSAKQALLKANQVIGRRLALSAVYPSHSGISIRPNDSSTSVHSLGEVAPNKT